MRIRAYSPLHTIYVTPRCCDSVTTVGSSQRIAVAVDGTVYVADLSNQRIRKVTPGGEVSTLAGTGLFGSADGPGTTAEFGQPRGIAVGADGTVYVADSGNHRIRKVTPGGVVTTLAGNGTPGFADSPGTTARFNAPTGVAVAADGTVYVANSNNQRIRKITPGGEVSTLAGDGAFGSADGPGTTARFNAPYGAAVGMDGNVYVADSGNHRIRRVAPVPAVDLIAPVVTASPAGGLFGAAQSVTLTSTEPGQIRYTLDGSTPTATTGLVYTAAVQVAATATLRFVATDAAGNTSPVVAETYTIDTIAPAVTISSAPPALTNDNTPTFAFAADETATFECSLSTGALAHALCTSPADYPAQADGTYTFTVRATDTVGNTATATHTFEINTVVPPVPGAPDLVPASDTGLSDTDNITSDTTPTLTGTAATGTLVTLLVDGVNAGTTTATGGTWTITSTNLNLGVHTAQVTATNAGGNTSAPSAALTFTVVAATACHTATNPITGTNLANLLRGTTAGDLIGAWAGTTTSPAWAARTAWPAERATTGSRATAATMNCSAATAPT